MQMTVPAALPLKQGMTAQTWVLSCRVGFYNYVVVVGKALAAS